MKKLNKIAVLIPCRNEAKGLEKVIDAIPNVYLRNLGYATDLYVVDNNSTDKTAEIAVRKKAIVIVESNRGKGYAILTGLRSLPLDIDFIIIIDGDDTYKAHEIPRLIEPLKSGFADMIVGSRLSGKTYKGSLSIEHRLANWFYTFLVRHFYRVNTTDVLSGFIGLKRSVADKLLINLESEGFEIEMEINIKASRCGFKIYSVPITYDIRQGESKIEGFRDAIKIFYAFFKYLNWKPTIRK